jgi:hypothetical protein
MVAKVQKIRTPNFRPNCRNTRLFRILATESRERTLINKVLASRLFASFVGECRKEFKKDYPKAVFSEVGIVDNYSKKKTDEVPVNVIMGVRGLAKFVGVGVTKAQEIVNSKILEEKRNIVLGGQENMF